MSNFVSAGQNLINGGVIHASIFPEGDQDSYAFFASAGDNIQLRVADMGAGSLTPLVSLFGPDGVYVSGDSSSLVADVGVTAPATGTYTVLVDDSSTPQPLGTGAYDLYFTRVPGANEHGVLINGGALSETIDLGDLDTYTFSASVGDNVQLRMTDVEGTLTPRVSLFGPDGVYVSGDSSSLVADVGVTAPATGTYTVLVDDSSTPQPLGIGAYDLYFTRVPGANEGGLLTNGVEVFDSIELGDLDSFTFLGAVDEVAQVVVTETSSSDLRPRIALYDPAGNFLTADGGSESAVVSTGIAVEGIYTVVVLDGNTPQPTGTGPYSIVVTGSGVNPVNLPNVILPPQFPTDPILADVGGDMRIGPKIGDPSEPFNFELDCTAATSPSVYVFELWSSSFSPPVPTQWGLLHFAGVRVTGTAGAHSQSVETWFPAPAGLVLDPDPSLVGIAYTVQGFCGGIGPWEGRLSSAVTQTIGS